jgi:hypothetical protein
MPLPSEQQPDPITATYRRVRSLLLSHDGFTDIVRPGNFPDMSAASFVQVKPQIQPGDLPEVLLFQSAFRMLPFGRNSMSAEVVQTFDLVTTIDKLQVTPLNAVKWQSFVALSNGGGDLGLTFVRDWQLQDGADDAFGQSQWKRETLRYVSMLRIVVTLSISRQSILLHN